MLKEVIRGDTVILDLQLLDENNNPVDLSFAQVVFTAKSDINKPDSQADIQVITTHHISPSQGKTRIKIPPSQTNNLIPYQVYYYDIQVSYSPDDIFTIYKGYFVCMPDITKRGHE